MTQRNLAADTAEMEERILLAFALNAARSMSCAELMVAAAVAKRPEDEAPAFERALYALRARGVVAFHVSVASGCQIPGVSVTDTAVLPTAAAAALRRRMGVHRRAEDDQDDPHRLRRVLVLPGPQLGDVGPCYPLPGGRADRD